MLHSKLHFYQSLTWNRSWDLLFLGLRTYLIWNYQVRLGESDDVPPLCVFYCGGLVNLDNLLIMIGGFCGQPFWQIRKRFKEQLFRFKYRRYFLYDPDKVMNACQLQVSLDVVATGEVHVISTYMNTHFGFDTHPNGLDDWIKWLRWWFKPLSLYIGEGRKRWGTLGHICVILLFSRNENEKEKVTLFLNRKPCSFVWC